MEGLFISSKRLITFNDGKPGTYAGKNLITSLSALCRDCRFYIKMDVRSTVTMSVIIGVIYISSLIHVNGGRWVSILTF